MLPREVISASQKNIQKAPGHIATGKQTDHADHIGHDISNSHSVYQTNNTLPITLLETPLTPKAILNKELLDLP
jgi:hypothetical protein